MKKIIQFAFLVLALLIPTAAAAQTTAAFNGFCDQGSVSSMTSGLASSNKLQGLIPQCTVTVYLTGTTNKATIYSDANNTVLTNPFKATINGQWLFYAATGQGYDVQLSGGIPPLTYTTPVTLTDLINGSGGGSGPIVEVNGTPISPSSPANFVDTSSVTWAFVGGQIQATSSGSGCIPGGNTGVFLYDNGAGGCSENYIDYGATTPNTLSVISPGDLNLYALSGVNSIMRLQVTGGEGTAIIATAPAVGGGIELRTDDGGADVQITGGTGTPTLNFFADLINLVHHNKGIVIQGDDSTINGAIQFYEGSSDDSAVCPTLQSSTQIVQICAPGVPGISPPASYTMILPSAQGSGALTNDGAGNLSWTPNSGGVTSINTVAGAFTFSFSSGAGSCSGTTCTFTGSGSGGGSVTNVIAGTLPSWLGLTVATSTTTPTLNFTASAIPNSSLANASTTVNGQTCTLGSTCTISAGGSVTSVGLAMPSIFSVSGSPVTSTGTLTAALTNETADFVFAGPCGGSAASPTFRALCAGDLPLATTSAFGAVKPDNATILVSAGVISVGTIPYTSVSGLGTFATQNYATPPAIGGTIPAAGAFSSLTDTGAASSAGLNCLQINNVGVISNTGSVCGAGGGGTQLQVNGGAVLVTANLSNTIPAAGTGYQNVIWQNTGASVSAEVPYATGSVFGIIKPDGTTCSVTTGVLTCGGAVTLWSAINNPTTSLSLTMLHYPTTFTFDATTGSGAMMTWQDTASNTGTGPIALFQTSSGSTALPWEALANGVGWKVGTNGALVSVGSTTHGITIPAGTAVSGLSANVIYASDATNGYAEVNENNTGLSRICTAANSVCAGAPGGTSGQLQYNNSGAFAGFTMSGDATVVPSTGIITVTKSNGTSFGTAAFVNTGTSGGTVPLLNTLDVFSGGIHYTKGGSASFSPIYDTGTPFTGGSATTNWPQVYFDYNTGSEPSWDAAGAGTVFGMNLPPGFGGAAIDIYAAGTDVFQVYSSGNTYALGYYLSSNGFKVTGGAEVQLYRCTTAGTLRVGQVTSVAADCGASNATGVYVN